ncbi:hypothetical protein Scep_001389 [Stephania cephalantha]|uniref:Uncharacterized protein n=1 Tax=Stephania cephalantha TaxID=152367 RepID=A0AAP0L7W2_9MAGN
MTELTSGADGLQQQRGRRSSRAARADSESDSNDGARTASSLMRTMALQRRRECDALQQRARQEDTTTRAAMTMRQCNDRREKRQRVAAGSGTVNAVEQRRGGALPDRSIPDETTTVDKLLSGCRRYLPIECTLGAFIRVCGYLIVARVRAGRQVSYPEPESAGLLPRLNELLIGTPCYRADDRGSGKRHRVPVKCTDRDRGLVMHRDKDKDTMFHLDRDFNVPVWECGQPGHFTSRCSQQRACTAEPGADSCYCQSNICCEDVALSYIDGRRQMVCSLLGDLEGAQLIMEEPSLSWRSPSLQSKMGVWPWTGMALGGLISDTKIEEIKKLNKRSDERREREKKGEREKRDRKEREGSGADEEQGRRRAREVTPVVAGTTELTKAPDETQAKDSATARTAELTGGVGGLRKRDSKRRHGRRSSPMADGGSSGGARRGDAFR